MADRIQTPSQTVGPFFSYGLTPEQYGYDYASLVSNDTTALETEGQRISIIGQLFDGAGEVIVDAMIEIWQADSQGRYAHPEDTRNTNNKFKGFARCGTGADVKSQFEFHTVKPGSPDGKQAPHINIMIFSRGLLSHVNTRLYFSDLDKENNNDPVLSAIEETRRDTLIAQRQESDENSDITYRFDIHMQGDNETVFFDL